MKQPYKIVYLILSCPLVRRECGGSEKWSIFFQVTQDPILPSLVPRHSPTPHRMPPPPTPKMTTFHSTVRDEERCGNIQSRANTVTDILALPERTARRCLFWKQSLIKGEEENTKILRPWVGGEGMMDCREFALKGKRRLRWLTSNLQLRSFN